MDFVHNPYRCGPLRVGRYALPTSKSVLKCNVLHQIQYHACEPVWYWGILD